jgi:hypothetical protein
LKLIILFNENKSFFFKYLKMICYKKMKLKWGLGIGDWGLGIGDWAQSPIPNEIIF